MEERLLKRNEIISLVLVFLVISLTTGSSGCLTQKKPDQSPNIPITSTINNSPVPKLIVPTPIPTTPIPSVQSGVRMFKDAESICIGQTLTFGLVNEGNSSIFFGVENPYWIQVYDNGIWGNIFMGGGFQGSWHLPPGSEIKKGWGFTGGGLYESYNKSDPNREFTVRPGLYRILFFGRNEETNEPITLATEFTIHECRSGIPI